MISVFLMKDCSVLTTDKKHTKFFRDFSRADRYAHLVKVLRLQEF